ncbi:MAG: heme A synthase [Bdellovibrionaceae bacterium]|nr:heme A synthase [Pseudobdellovibrionaceae bacterium]
MLVSRGFLRLFYGLVVATVGLMALGAGVRAMNAGLSCPDWPLCFGQVIPDFHVGVWFEFVHRAYAGLVALVFFGCLGYLLFKPQIPRLVKRIGVIALAVLLLQIIMGGLTVLKLLKVSVVTSHLMLATTFAACLFLIGSMLNPNGVRRGSQPAPDWFRTLALIFPVATFGQIWLGGLVASSYAGAVCVDFPLCNGQWVPTLHGAIGLQVMHRFGAYTLFLFAFAIFGMVHAHRRSSWMTSQVSHISRALLFVVLAQVGVGIANLLMYIPPGMTVLHQSVAIVILLTGIRFAYIANRIAASAEVTAEAYPAARQAQTL